MARQSRIALFIGLLFLAGSSTFAAAQTPADWPRVFDGMADGAVRLLYAGACDLSAPAFGDLDGDGDLDLVVGTKGSAPVYFRNDGTPRAARWTFVPEGLGLPPLASLGISCAPALGDMDNDGDVDLLLGLGNGQVAYYRNDGTPTEPAWVKATEDLTGAAVSGAAMPAVVDIDFDGDLDLFIGEGFGQLVRYENTAVVAGVPELTHLSDFYNGISIFSQAAPFFCDINGDQLPDLFIGDDTGRIHLYQGFGLPERDQLFHSIATSSHYANLDVARAAAPCFADIDNDHALDLFVGSEAGAIVYLENAGNGHEAAWRPPVPVWQSVDGGSDSAPEFADIDGDGDLDLFLAAIDVTKDDFDHVLRFYRNQGTPWLPNWVLEDDDMLGLRVSAMGPRLVDIDDDGDLDLYVADADANGLRYFHNDGSASAPVFNEDPASSITLDGSYFYPSTAFADMDGDGDYDLWIGCVDFSFSYVLYYQNMSVENTGSPGNADWAAPIDFAVELDAIAVPYPSVAAGDINGDGKPDLVIGDPMSSYESFYCLCASTETLAFDAARAFAGTAGENLAMPALADLDGDLRLDLALGGSSGGLRVFRNPLDTFLVQPHHATVVHGQTIDFSTAPPRAGTWDVAVDASGGGIDPATGHYTAGGLSGTDTIRFRDGLTSWGVAYVNVISPADLAASGKAIVMAGTSGVESDPLWKTTNELAHSVYRSLLYRGFSKDSIFYLNPDTVQDVDRNGFDDDDIRAASSLVNIGAAMTWAQEDTSELFVYLLDHGEERDYSVYVRCNETDVLHGSTLDGWLDELQDQHDVTTVTLVVDCCQAGGFLNKCHATAGQTRVVIGSSDHRERAYFLAGGLVSFTRSFINGLYSGMPVGQAFDLAAGAMDRHQTPQLDDDGNAVYDKDTDGVVARQITVGASSIAGADRPQLGRISANQALVGGDVEATIWAADVSSVYPLERVWATIVDPDFVPAATLDPSQPVIDMPQLELSWSAANERYEATTDTFTQLGAYAINVYAEDIWGGVAYPKQTYVNQAGSDEQIVIVCGDGDYDVDSPWSFSDSLAQLAYETARARWLIDEKISYLSSSVDPAVDTSPTQTNLADALTSAAGISKLTVYLVGAGDATAFDIDGDGADAGDVTPAELDAWLDTVQATTPTLVIVVLDFGQSGDWVAPLSAARRLIITSCAAGEESWCEEDGTLSFSQWFFSGVFNGVNLRDSFNWARAAGRVISGEQQNATLDDNGDGEANSWDGALALTTFIGATFVPGVDKPVIDDYASSLTLTSGTATLWASGVHAASGIAEVYAYVTRPGATPGDVLTERVELAYTTGTARWQVDYASFDPANNQTIVYFARSRKGRLSDPYRTVFGPAQPEDSYDRFFDDDTSETLNFISSDDFSQAHNLWEPGDEDWAAFNIDEGEIYDIVVSDQATSCNAAIYLYHESDLSTPLLNDPSRDEETAGGADEIIVFPPDGWAGPVTGTMLIRVTQSPSSPNLFGNGTSYTLSITSTWGDRAGLGTISGTQMKTIGPDGDTLTVAQNAGGRSRRAILRRNSAGDIVKQADPITYIYTKHQVVFPAGALSTTHTFTIDDPNDMGPDPWYSASSAWLAAHPTNASIVCIYTDATGPAVSLAAPVEVTMQFVDDGGRIEDSFDLDDIPPGNSAADMRIYIWNKATATWGMVPGSQSVVGDTVTVSLDQLGSGMFAAGPAPGTGNQSPSFTSASVIPVSPNTATTLAVVCGGWSDGNGDPEGYHYQWRKNASNIPGAIGPTLASGSFAAYDSISCVVTAWDGIVEGNSIETAPVIIAPLDGDRSRAATWPRYR
ncbi:FG-GAP and VCBS repeat-containing protein [Candidatus Sumerlaeota bacterium]